MARAPSRRLLPPLLLLLLALRAAAHRPLLTGPVGGKVYDTWQTALLVPWVTSSWSVKRVVECDAPIFWLKFQAERANQDVHITAVVPAAPGLAALRVGMALFGPGLPKYNASQLAFPGPPAKPGQGMVRISSPADQSTCRFLENKSSKRAYAPANSPGVGPRCSFFEPFSKSELWITADRNVTLPVKGAYYYLAAFLDGRKSTGKFSVAIADWAESEDFRRPYTMGKGNRNDTGSANAVAECCPATGGGAATAAGGGGGGGGGAPAAKPGDISRCPPFAAFGCDPASKERALQPPAPVKALAPAAAHALMTNEGWPYLDVRSPEELASGRVPGSVNVPLYLSRPSGRVLNKDFVDQVEALFLPCTKLVVGCHSGRRSMEAATLLRGSFADVVSVDGGIVEWKAAGLPVIV